MTGLTDPNGMNRMAGLTWAYSALDGAGGCQSAVGVTMLFITHALPKGLGVDEVVRIGGCSVLLAEVNNG